jgi:hypothetical protein
MSNTRTPAYVLPLVLTVLVTAIYIGITHVKNKADLALREKHLGTVEQRLTDLQQNLRKDDLAIQLLAVLHNENFYILHKATGTNEIIYVNGDWTINRMPSHLDLTPAQVDMIHKRFVNHY